MLIVGQNIKIEFPEENRFRSFTVDSIEKEGCWMLDNETHDFVFLDNVEINHKQKFSGTNDTGGKKHQCGFPEGVSKSKDKRRRI